jgi:anti-sigma-K factor RskA
MMSTEHAHWLERGDIYALGALDGEELKDFQTHLATECSICKTYIQETRETLNLLHRSLRPMTPSPEVKERVLEHIDSENVVSLTVAKPKESRRWQRITGTIAAGIIGIALASAYYHYRGQSNEAMNSAVVNLLRDPSTHDLPLYGAGPTPAAKGRFLWNKSGEGHIFVTNLPVAPEGKMYVVWTIAQKSAPHYVGTIQTDANGEGAFHIRSARSTQPVETFAVTLENKGTIAAPAGPIVLVSKQS